MKGKQSEDLRLGALPSEIIEQVAFFTAISRPTAVSTEAQAEIQVKDHLQTESSTSPGKPEGSNTNDAQSSLSTCSTTTATQSPAPLPPSNLIPLLLASSHFHSLLSLSANPRLYAKIFRHKFDIAAIERRYGKEAVNSFNLAEELVRRCVRFKRMRLAVSVDTLGHEENEEERINHLNENLWTAYMCAVENDGKNTEVLAWAQVEDYLRLHHTQEMLESAVQPGYPPDTPDRALALHLSYLLTDQEKLANESREDSDEKLFVLRPFVFAAHKFDGFHAPWTIRNLPLEPPNSRRDSLSSSSRGREDRRRSGGQLGAEPHEGGTLTNPFLADLTPRPRICTLRHCGQTFQLVPPVLSHAACLSFFSKVEIDPAVIGLTAILDGADGNAETGPNRDQTTPADGIQFQTQTPQAVDQQVIPPINLPAHRSPLSLTSVDHDRDLARLFACANPRSSPGLRPLFYAGQFAGNWEGRFCFFDFDSYREMLAGRMRSLYEGPFGEQPQVWKLEEKIVRIPYGEKEGGRGPTLAAGFLSHEEEEALDLERSQEHQFKVERQTEHIRKDDGEAESSKDGENWSSPSKRKGKGKQIDPYESLSTGPTIGNLNEGEQPPPHIFPYMRSQNNPASFGMSSSMGKMGEGLDYKKYEKMSTSGQLPHDWDSYPSFGEDEPHDERDEGDYEILINGSGHSAWGRFVLRGRIRSWDGMIIIAKEYRPDGRGRWLYRGYVTAGGKMIGRWRDTFTPDNMSGYEGCFLLHRRDA